MMSAQQMNRMADEACRRSRREGILPNVFTAEELEDPVKLAAHAKRIPFIGTRRPRGFKLLNASGLIGEHGTVPFGDSEGALRRHEAHHYIEVDSSGFGQPGELALTGAEFFAAIRKIGPGKAYAIVEAGQFQVVVGVFERRAA
jgi:hypothetical protein